MLAVQAALLFILQLTVVLTTASPVAAEPGAVRVKVGESRVVDLRIKKRQQVCVTEGQRSKGFWDALSPHNFFRQTTMEIRADAKRASFPYFSFRGKSTDDFHENVGLLVRQGLFSEGLSDGNAHGSKGLERTDSLDFWPLVSDTSSLLRDVLSSCPGPFDFEIGNAQTTLPTQGNSDAVVICKMTFSSMGTPCVSLPPKAVSNDRQSKVTVTVNQRINLNYAYSLGFCILFLFSATKLSEHKSFQYVTGMGFFVVAGLLLVVIYFDKLVGPGLSKSNSSRTRSLGFLLTTSALYSASLAYFVQTTLRRLLVDYWEVAAAYVVIMALFGVAFTRLMRSKDATKHVFRVSAKWILRIIGFVAGYNSSPSPLSSSLLLSALAVMYAVHWCLKFLGKSSKSHPSNNKSHR